MMQRGYRSRMSTLSGAHLWLATIVLVVSLGHLLCDSESDYSTHPATPSTGTSETSGGTGGQVDVTRSDWPCTGCRTYAPPGAADSAVPLLVALHGDEGDPGTVVSVWRSVAEDKGMVLFAPKCPRDQGCNGSWWQWGGDPAWLDAQVNAVMNQYNIDLRRVYFTAWSGGATYGAVYAAVRADRYAAINLNSGGTQPYSSCPSCTPPMSWIVGGNDGLKVLVEAAYTYFTNCGTETELVVLDGVGHNLAPFLSSGGADDIATWALQFTNECEPWPR